MGQKALREFSCLTISPKKLREEQAKPEAVVRRAGAALAVLVPVLSLVIVLLLAGDASAFCGDGLLDPNDECCDDGNVVSGDGCNDDCTCPSDHLKCYKIKDPLKLKGFVDLNSPQFGLEAGCKIKKATKFCVPATKTVISAEVRNTPIVPIIPPPIVGEELLNDYICYKIKCQPPFPPDTLVIDQFGSRTLSKFKAFELCGPVRKCADISSDLSTGTGGVGNPDPLWTLASVPVGAPQPSLAPPLAVEIIGAWATAIEKPKSEWITATTISGSNCRDSNCPDGDYVYKSCWRQCGDVTLDLQLLADNCVKVEYVQNGLLPPVLLDETPLAECGSLTPLQVPFVITDTIPATSSPFGDDIELIVTVLNQGTTITGMDLFGSATGLVPTLCP